MAEQPHQHTQNPAPTPQQLAAQRRELTPDATTAFLAFSGKVFAPGALDAKAKQIIAVAPGRMRQTCRRTNRRRQKPRTDLRRTEAGSGDRRIDWLRAFLADHGGLRLRGLDHRRVLRKTGR